MHTCARSCSQLRQEPPNWQLALSAVARAAKALPAEWVRRDAHNELSMCAKPLHSFVMMELQLALGRALAIGSDAAHLDVARQQRTALLEHLGLPSGAR